MRFCRSRLPLSMMATMLRWRALRLPASSSSSSATPSRSEASGVFSSCDTWRRKRSFCSSSACRRWRSQSISRPSSTMSCGPLIAGSGRRSAWPSCWIEALSCLIGRLIIQENTAASSSVSGISASASTISRCRVACTVASSVCNSCCTAASAWVSRVRAARMQRIECGVERMEARAVEKRAGLQLAIQRAAACLQRGQRGARRGVGEPCVELRQLGLQLVEARPQGGTEFGVLQQMVLPGGALQLADRFDDLPHVARDGEAVAGELALGVDHALQHVHRVDQAAGQRHDQHAHGDDDQDGERAGVVRARKHPDGGRWQCRSIPRLGGRDGGEPPSRMRRVYSRSR